MGNPFVNVIGETLTFSGTFTYSGNNGWRVTDGSLLIPKGIWLCQTYVACISTNAVNQFRATLNTNNANNATGELGSALFNRLATTTITSGTGAAGGVFIYNSASDATLYLKVFAEDANSETISAYATLIRLGY